MPRTVTRYDLYHSSFLYHTFSSLLFCIPAPHPTLTLTYRKACSTSLSQPVYVPCSPIVRSVCMTMIPRELFHECISVKIRKRSSTKPTVRSTSIHDTSTVSIEVPMADHASSCFVSTQSLESLDRANAQELGVYVSKVIDPSDINDMQQSALSRPPHDQP